MLDLLDRGKPVEEVAKALGRGIDATKKRRSIVNRRRSTIGSNAAEGLSDSLESESEDSEEFPWATEEALEDAGAGAMPSACPATACKAARRPRRPLPPIPAEMDNPLLSTLRQFFGVDEFRQGQEEVIASLWLHKSSALAHCPCQLVFMGYQWHTTVPHTLQVIAQLLQPNPNDELVVWATSSGKSLIYHMVAIHDLWHTWCAENVSPGVPSNERPADENVSTSHDANGCGNASISESNAHAKECTIATEAADETSVDKHGTALAELADTAHSEDPRVAVQPSDLTPMNVRYTARGALAPNAEPASIPPPPLRIPALSRNKTTKVPLVLVVSPTRAIMCEQVNELNELALERGLEDVATWFDVEGQIDVRTQLSGRYALVFITPEKLLSLSVPNSDHRNDMIEVFRRQQASRPLPSSRNCAPAGQRERGLFCAV